MAAAYLKEKGYRILERNYHAGRGAELDILAEKDGVLVAVECKYRMDNMHGDPLEAVDYRKQHKICHALLHYCMMHGISPERDFRFDVIAIYGNGEIRHLEDAFPFRR